MTRSAQTRQVLAAMFCQEIALESDFATLQWASERTVLDTRHRNRGFGFAAYLRYTGTETA